MLAILGATGKLGSATLSALLKYNLVPPSQIICTTSAPPDSSKWTSLSSKRVQVRFGTFDDPESLFQAFQGCDKLFLISSPRIRKDFFDAPLGKGREEDHVVAIDAAVRAGVKHIYYTSLAFGWGVKDGSKAGVMQAHLRTEEYLRDIGRKGEVNWTAIREGLYNESWPLYFGHYDTPDDDREEVIVAGDGSIAWTSIQDLGVANAVVLASPEEEYENKVFYLSNTGSKKRLSQIAEIVSSAKGKDVQIKVVSREEHERFYIEKKEMDEGRVKWWAKTYDALKNGECDVEDTTLETLLRLKGLKPKPVEETVKEMLRIQRL